MRKSPLIFLAITAVLISSLACGLPSVLPSVPVPTLDANGVGTAIKQTMVAAAAQTAGAVAPVGMVGSPTLLPQASATLSPTALLSPVPDFTGTPLIPLISVSMDTNCRSGPGQAYERVGALMVGEVTEVYGRNPTGKYWYVKNLDPGSEYCWLWGEYATVVGNVSALYVFTPPPTPTPVPSYDAEYAGLEKCSGWWVDIQLTNTSSTAFRSISAIVKDLSTDKEISLYADRFTAIDDCVDTTTNDALNPGQTLMVSVPAFASSPEGHKLRATVTLCSLPGRKGDCITQTLKFSP